MLAPARASDASEQVQFADGRAFDVGGGGALVLHESGVVYLAMALRNVGAGMAVLRGYRLQADTAEQAQRDPLGAARHRRGEECPDPSAFSQQQRDLYIPANDLGFWQAALRDRDSTLYRDTVAAIAPNGRVTVDVLYTDHEGGQRTISAGAAMSRITGTCEPLSQADSPR
jgi:hypothetical protein